MSLLSCFKGAWYHDSPIPKLLDHASPCPCLAAERVCGTTAHRLQLLDHAGPCLLKGYLAPQLTDSQTPMGTSAGYALPGKNHFFAHARVQAKEDVLYLYLYLTA